MSDTAIFPTDLSPTPSRRRFLRSAGALFVGASVPLPPGASDHPVRERQWASAPAGHAWLQFGSQLALALSDLGEDEFLIVAHKGRTRCVQFAGQGRFGMTPAEDQAEGAVDGSPNWFLDVAWPVPFDEVAALATRTLREALRIAHPGWLEYEAFAEPYEAIRFPSLRLKRAARRDI